MTPTGRENEVLLDENLVEGTACGHYFKGHPNVLDLQPPTLIHST